MPVSRMLTLTPVAFLPGGDADFAFASMACWALFSKFMNTWFNCPLGPYTRPIWP